MSNRNLLLTDEASVNTKPELEIYADDVKASHGTTVGQVDENAIYYLRTRGISPSDAERMLTSAFAADVLGEIRISDIEEEMRAGVEAYLDSVIGA